ncbi:hypothetical protein D9M70_344420 [compost metagenome]
MVGVGHWLAGRAAQVRAELPRQLAGALHTTTGAARSLVCAGQQSEPAVQVGAAATQNVALPQQRREVAGQGAESQGLAAQQQVGDARVGRQLGHGLPMAGQAAVFGQGAEALQQVATLGVGGGRRWVEPGQFIGVANAPTRQLQGQAGEVGLEDFSAAVGSQLFVLRLRPEPVTGAGLQAPGTAGALGGGGAGYALGVQPGHAAGRVEARHPLQAGVHHHAYAIDGQAGLGDVGGQHHLALARRRRLDGGTLGGQVQVAVQRAEQDVAAPVEPIGQLLGHATDLRLAGQEYQQAAGLVGQGLEHRLHHLGLQGLARLGRPAPALLHRVHAAFAAHHRRVIQQARQTLAFQGGRHQHDLQRRLVAQQRAAVEAEGQGQVGVQAALVEFVEDHQADPFQRRVLLQAAGEDALGDHLDARARADFRLQADAVADRLADLLAQLAGQALGGGAGGQATRLQHEDALPGQPGFVEQGERHSSGLAGTGRCLQHGLVAGLQGGLEVGQDGVYG